jgi:hypothetical protein
LNQAQGKDKFDRMKTTLMLLSIVIMTSCESIKKTVIESYRYEMYIDFRNVSYQGQNSTQRLYLEIDSTDGIWYRGKLIVDDKDTMRIRGFEKGSHYVTTYTIMGSEKEGGLEIWCRGETGQIRDSLTIEDRDKTKGMIFEKTVLYRQPRKSCH